MRYSLELTRPVSEQMKLWRPVLRLHSLSRMLQPPHLTSQLSSLVSAEAWLKNKKMTLIKKYSVFVFV